MSTSIGAGRVLVGGIGYSNLRDMSAGPLVIESLGDLGGAVDVEDISYSPIDVLFALGRRPPYARAILIGALARGDAPGTVRRRDGVPAVDVSMLQERIAEALSGVISLENSLQILAHFKGLPPEVTVIEIEPENDSWGPDVSAAVARGMNEAARLVKHEVGG